MLRIFLVSPKLTESEKALCNLYFCVQARDFSAAMKEFVIQLSDYNSPNQVILFNQGLATSLRSMEQYIQRYQRYVIQVDLRQ